MNEREIQHALFCHYAGSSILMVPNIYVNGSIWESDLVRITRNFYRYEYEIKVSRSDFLNEFRTKKGKHNFFLGSQRGPNYFYFAVPDGLIKADEIDKRYGLVYLKQWKGYDYIGASVVRRPKLLHKSKVGDKTFESLARSLMYKVFHDRATMRTILTENHYLKEKVNQSEQVEQKT